MKVAIIGAGASGLPAIKTCLEAGLEPVCFEMEDELGGLWRFTEDRSSHSSVYRSTVINTSKEMMCYSDFTIPKEFPPYMHNTYVMKYMHLYAENFGLLKYIRFKTLVESVRRAGDFIHTGQWEIKYKDIKEGTQYSEIYDAVFVCTGHHWSPNFPKFAGLDNFTGTVIHSHYYKDYHEFVGKKVVVIGIGNSGGDLAVELSYHAEQVYLSTRRGAWVLPRMECNGVPLDMVHLRRFLTKIPKTWLDKVLQNECNRRFDHANFGLLPEHGIFSQHPMVNDILPHRIFTGSIIVKTDISHFTERGVVFKDETKLEDVDAVILCTGYDISFPVLDDSDVPVVENQVNLYKYVFPPQHCHPTLAIIGLFQAAGALNPLCELQVRWAVQVFKGEKKLPSREKMEADIKQKKDAISKLFYASRRHTLQVDYIDFADELAELVGCRPNLLKLFFQDPALALKCFFGPCTPPQFRLFGPHPWPGAKKAIEMAHHNCIFPTKTRVLMKSGKEDSSGVMFFLKWLVLPPIIGVLFVAAMKWSPLY